ncbi:MAG: alpha/beta hydrolase [Pirellula sp.]
MTVWLGNRNSEMHSRYAAILFILVFLAMPIFVAVQSMAQERNGLASYEIKKGISYVGGDSIRKELADSYRSERCLLDVYYPKNLRDAPVVVWFHGGGLTGGERSIPEGLKNKGFVVIAANYRLSPKAKAPAYIEDAAAAVAWAVANATEYHGSPSKIVVSGHSAGGYLAMMVGLDRTWLEPYNVAPSQLAGIAPLSGQAITHFTIRDERGIDKKQPVIDALAPLYHVRRDAPPILLVTGDRNEELLGRYEENAYLWRMMKESGHEQVTLYELQGFNHGAMVEPGIPLLVKFVQNHCSAGRPTE